MAEKTVSVVVEAIGEIAWRAAAPDADPRQLEPRRVALVRDEEGTHYIVNDGQCFRNGTTLSADIVGLRGAIEVYQCSPISFNCPTMFGKRGL